MDDLERLKRRTAAKWAALKRLRVTNIRCHCGETDPICFEADHVDRRSYSHEVWGICKNCHAKRTTRHQTEHPTIGLHPGDPFERMGHSLLGMYDYLTFIAERLRLMAEIMFKLAGRGIVIED